MTTNEKRIKVLEWMGWRSVGERSHYHPERKDQSIHGEHEWWLCGFAPGSNILSGPPPLVLEWVQGCENNLTREQWIRYAHFVSETKIPCPDGTVEEWTLFEEYGWYGLLKATAEQRLDALVETIGEK